MKKLAKLFKEEALKGLLKAKLDGRKWTYRMNIYSISVFAPLVVSILWAIYDNLMNVEYRIEDEFIFLGFLIASVFNTVIGIKVGRTLLIREQQQASFELIESMRKQIEQADIERLKDEN